MSAPDDNQPEANLPQSSPETVPRELSGSIEPLDELLAQSKIFADYVASLASEE